MFEVGLLVPISEIKKNVYKSSNPTKSPWEHFLFLKCSNFLGGENVASSIRNLCLGGGWKDK